MTKPFAVDFHDGKADWQAVQRTNRVATAGTQRRSTPEFPGAAKAMQSGMTGKVQIHFQEQRRHKDPGNVKPEDADWQAFQSGNRINPRFGAKGTLDRCVRSRETPCASVDSGFHHAVAGCMAAVSLGTGRRAAFDPDKLEIVRRGAGPAPDQASNVDEEKIHHASNS